MPYDREYDGHYEGRDDGFLRRDASRSGSARQYPRRPHDYDGMYDEGQDDRQYHEHEAERYSDDPPHNRERDSRKSRSPGNQYSRSRSHSPTREAGRPSDTVILEGLPFGLSASEVGTLAI